MNKIICGILLFVFFNTLLFAEEYHVNKTHSNIVKFISDAPVEDFEGITDNIDGYLYYEETLEKNSQLYFEVDLRLIDTGIGLRNRHMRDNYLETDKYPFAIFQGKIDTATLQKEKSYLVNASGKFTTHGVTVPIQIEANVTIGSADLHVTSKFIVKLSDHKIDVPELMFMKIDENMEINLDFKMIKKD